MVVDRASANDPGMAAVVRAARFVYLAGGSPLHLRSVLKGSATFEALREAWPAAPSSPGSAAGAMVLTDPMVDPRGGALTVGLGLVDQLAVVPHFGDGHDDAHGQKLERTVALAPDGLPVVGLPERTALLREGERDLALRGERDPRWSSSEARGPRVSARCSAEAPRPAQSFSSMVTDSITTSSVGVPERVPRASIVVTTSPPADHGAEEGVLRRQAHPVGSADDEELAPVGVGPGVGHGQRSDLVAARARAARRRTGSPDRRCRCRWGRRPGGRSPG